MEAIGIISLVFAIIGLITSIWYVGIIPCAVGIALGIVALTDYLSDKKFAVAGLLISILGAVMSVYMFVSDVDSGRLIVLYNNGKTESEDISNDNGVNSSQNINWNANGSDRYNYENEKYTSYQTQDKYVNENIGNIQGIDATQDKLDDVQSNEKIVGNDNSKEIDYYTKDPIFYTYENSIGEMDCCFIQEIENKGNSPIYLKECTVDLEDGNGHLLANLNYISSCPDIILPGEKGYFYNSIISSTLNDSVKNATSIKAIPNIKVEKADANPVEYVVSDTSLVKDDFGKPMVVGRVTNRTSEDDNLLYLNVIFFDINGNVASITGTNITDLLSGETKSFECSSLYAYGNTSYDDIVNYKVVARKSYYQF